MQTADWTWWPAGENEFQNITVQCITKRTILRKKHRVTKHWDIPPSSRSVRPLGTPQCDHRQRDYRCAALGHLGWVIQASLGKQLLGVQRRAQRSALRAVGWSCSVNCSVHRIRAQDLPWKAGFSFWRVCTKKKKPQQHSALNISVHIELFFCKLLFHASEVPVLYQFHSILHDLKFFFGHLLVFIMQSNVWWLHVSHH